MSRLNAEPANIKGCDDTQAARRVYNRHDNILSPDEVDDDIPPDHLEQLKTSFYSTKVMVCAQESNSIERCTVDQADNELWLCERRKRITASNVGMIAKMKATTKCSKKVEQLLYSKFRGNTATRFGISYIFISQPLAWVKHYTVTLTVVTIYLGSSFCILYKHHCILYKHQWALN